MKTALLLSILFTFGSGLLALTSFGTSAPVINDTAYPSLPILSPNGEEASYISYTRDITWSANDTEISLAEIIAVQRSYTLGVEK